MKIAFCLNGENRTEEVAGGEMLIDLLRDRLHVRSVKRGCENAECGACTVLVNGLAVNACIYLAARIDGKTVTTLEGVGGPESLHPIQQAFIEHGAVQCGFCGRIRRRRNTRSGKGSPGICAAVRGTRRSWKPLRMQRSGCAEGTENEVL